ncbi:cytosine permease [Brevibacterium casei]|uniref:Purine/cytosine permease n=1 Tax=Brevibacterium casei TaxID=33889 RepID=A0A269ZGH5_9MICO|nr:cytosine permease [Brevibacterium casei]PAK96908.1 purine/cytosine permease [Brevibacterium casei]QQT70263.1 cytosine permease [Brevibacterium casei]
MTSSAQRRAQTPEVGTKADRFGRVERAGVDYVPVSERRSTPGNLFRVFVGGNLALSVVIFGWLPITFGLSFWQAVASSAVGLVIGLLLMVPMTLLGTRTGTNNPVSSGAHFGMRGRLLGSTLTLLFAIAYAAIAVWTSGEALVAGAHRLFGTAQDNTAFLIGYAVIAVEVVLIALYGHGTIVALQKIIIPVAGILLCAGVIAYAPGFDPAPASTEYLLGDFWPTWFFAVTISIGGPLSYAPSVGDYTRRISPRRFSDFQVALAACAGIFTGLFATAMFGAFTASTFDALSPSYVADLVANAPAWYLAPLLVLAIMGGFGQGVINIYASGLDLESIIPRLSRTQTTLITSGVAVVIMYLGVIAADAIASITAMTVVLNAFAGTWVVINGIGFLVARRGCYDPTALQRFGFGLIGGRYWFLGGWNLRAVVPFLVGSCAGLLTVQNELYAAPLAGVAGGIDISLPVSMTIGGGLYLCALRIWPETGVDDDIRAVAEEARR